MCFEIMEAEVLVYAPRGWGRGLRPESAARAPVTDPVRSGTWLSQEEGLGKGCGFGPGSREGLGSGLLAVGKQGAVRRRLRDPCPGAAVTSTTHRLTHCNSKFSQSGGRSLK